MTLPNPASSAVALGEEVADALASGRPLVALESTIISHGMPYPDNVAMAREVEAIAFRASDWTMRNWSCWAVIPT